MKKAILMALFLFLSVVIAQEGVQEEESQPKPVQTVWDGNIVVQVGREYSMPFDYISSGDRIEGAFETGRGEKVNFYIIRERAGNEPPLDRKYMVNSYEFNVTVPYEINEADERESTVAKYFLTFDNTHGINDVTIYYRINIVPAGEAEAGQEGDGLLDRIRDRF